MNKSLKQIPTDIWLTKSLLDLLSRWKLKAVKYLYSKYWLSLLSFSTPAY